jgi:hypothetical protein
VIVARAAGAKKRETVALDLAASLAEERGDTVRAESLRNEAHDAALRWGAAALAERLLRARAR